MAAGVVVSCGECKKRFKPKGDVQGKRIKCPYCKGSISVPKADVKAVPKKPEKPEAEMTAEEKAEKAKAEFDAQFDDKSAYDVQHIELVPRCPNCTFEMGPNDIICLNCGYNTLTREWGKTEKVVGLTWDRHLKHLGPAIGAACFVFFSVIGMVYFAILLPYDVNGTMFRFLDHESMRMWGSVIFLLWLFGAGIFCVKKFIENPKPADIMVEETDD